jgi:hypothetical protein
MLTAFTFTLRQKSTVELYDETQRLCDANLTVPALKIVVPDGDLELKRRNQNIGEHFSLRITGEYNACVCRQSNWKSNE